MLTEAHKESLSLTFPVFYSIYLFPNYLFPIFVILLLVHGERERKKRNRNMEGVKKV